MSRRIIRHHAAVVDIIELATFIGQHQPDAAVRFIDALDETIQQIGEFPFAAASIELRTRTPVQRRRPVRGFPNHLVFYRIDDDVVEIVRVLHGSRDWFAMFNG